MFIEIQDTKDEQIIALNVNHVVKVGKDTQYGRYATMIELVTGSYVFTMEDVEAVKKKVSTSR
jgi:hypothetical protein